MDPSKLIAGRTRETAIRRDARGRWWNGEDPIDHPNLVRAFDAWLDVADDGRFCLKNDINWAYVAIEGAPLLVRSTTVSGSGAVTLFLSDGTEEALEVSTLRQNRDGVLYCDARRGRLVARFSREATLGLEDLLDEDESGIFLLIGNDRVRPPVVDDPLKSE
jgi:hypothetical protein